MKKRTGFLNGQWINEGDILPEDIFGDPAAQSKKDLDIFTISEPASDEKVNTYAIAEEES